MAIRFDDRIETNVAGDVLITGNQIAVSDDGQKIEIGTYFTDSTVDVHSVNRDVFINSDKYTISRDIVNITKLSDLQKAINQINENNLYITTSLIGQVIANSTNDNVTIDTNNLLFGNLEISSKEKLDEVFAKIPVVPLIVTLSCPIHLSTGGSSLHYATSNDLYAGSKFNEIPKGSLICVLSTKDLPQEELTTEYTGLTFEQDRHVYLLKDNIQILSMPLSADSIHNDFETRIAKIESLLTLK